MNLNGIDHHIALTEAEVRLILIDPSAIDDTYHQPRRAEQCNADRSDGLTPVRKQRCQAILTPRPHERLHGVNESGGNNSHHQAGNHIENPVDSEILNRK